MNEKHYIGKHAKSITLGIKNPPITKVILSGDNDAVFTAGDDSGQVLETFVPTATQQMANDILSKVQGFEYQGYTANNAFLPPTIELGDGITVGGVYGVLASREYSFTPKMTETVSAPYKTEEDHEYGYTGNYAQDIKNKVQQGQLYYGTRISKKNGLEIVKTDGTIEKSRVTLNSDLLAFYNDNGQEAFYFDSATGVFRLTQYANVEDALDGSQAFSKLELTAHQLTLEMNDAKGNISSLQITASQLQSQITDANNNISAIEQYAKSIRLSVSNGYETSTITLTANGVAISSGSITFTGAVTFLDLSTSGSTVINGNNITTGTISANRLNLTGAIWWSDLSNNLQGTINDISDDAYYAAVDAANALSAARTAQNAATDAQDDVWNLANGVLRGGTFIDRQSIYSPTIYSQDMNIIAQSNSGGLYLYGPYDSRGYCMLAIEYYEGDVPYVNIYSPAGGYIELEATYIGRSTSAMLEIKGSVMFYGSVDFSHATVRGLE